jgi:ubiquitin carboxyl-terminal hydrolase 7
MRLLLLMMTGAVPGPMQDGADLAPKRLVPGGLKFTKFSNAYMLVYVRVSDWPRIMVPVTKDDIAAYLRERLEVCPGGGVLPG